MTGGSNTPRRRSIGKKIALVVCLSLVGLTVLIAFVTSLGSDGFASAIGGVLIVASLAALLMGVFTLLVGHFRTAKLAGRKAGAALTAVGLVAFVGGGVLVGGNVTTDTVTTAAATSSVTASPKTTTTPTQSAKPSKTSAASPTSTASSTSAAPDTASDTAALIAAAKPQTALAILGTLQVKGRAPKTGYSRDAFGEAWTDTDHNGCDTRNDVLNRDLTALSWTDTVKCTVMAGALADPYSGKPIAFTRGETTSTAVQIDHVVALSDAWQTGAQYWDVTKRSDFANDSLELLAVDGPLNEQKSDGDAATWLPPNTAYRCD